MQLPAGCLYASVETAAAAAAAAPATALQLLTRIWASMELFIYLEYTKYYKLCCALSVRTSAAAAAGAEDAYLSAQRM